ncbi:alanine/ornithine racemase family PLP-dependent enzyme [Bacillus solimangrovi]|uniref:Alanine racemase N-terminal domain-containing protein n=1 Tax=Bacillus solimangrovi TaxID=1305675 RepID=A0A1E5LCK1_9BACI|nr:alanine/ornithine racemase family PLP-dependent enzyme [Bacillus solimangrovi]OEH91749.1 hypothetical protein BFG57_17755 [Bacillus solimangrovi]
MEQQYPMLTINLSKIKHNASYVRKKCVEYGVHPFIVTKGVSADVEIIRSVIDVGYLSFADSRLQNVAKLKLTFPNAEYMMLRIPGRSEIESVVDLCDISLNSEWETIYQLNEAALKRGQLHRIILMVELGDLREGIQPEFVIPMIEKVMTLRGIRIDGIGSNLGCYSSVYPTEEKLLQLTELANEIEEKLGRTIEVVSGGNSSTLPLIFAGRQIGGVNQLRIGETIYLGLNTVDGSHIRGLYQNAFRLEAEIVEIQIKPSGDKARQQLLMGNASSRVIAIVSLGQQDLDLNNLKPLNPHIKILGGTSDHLMVDITDAKPMNIGETLSFQLNYNGLLRCMTSSFISKTYTYERSLEKRMTNAKVKRFPKKVDKRIDFHYHCN